MFLASTQERKLFHLYNWGKNVSRSMRQVLLPKVLSKKLSGAVPEVSVACGRINVGLGASKGAAPVMVGGPKLAPFSPKTGPGVPPAEEALEDAPWREAVFVHPL